MRNLLNSIENQSRIGTFCCLILTCTWSNAQTLVTNAKADNNVLYPGAIVSFNATDALVAFNFTTVRDLPARPGTGLVYSIQASGKPTDGVGPIFSAGDFSPDASVKGAFGYRWGNEPYEAYAQVDKLSRELAASENKFNTDINALIDAEIGAVSDIEGLAVKRLLRDKMIMDKTIFDKLIDDAVKDPYIAANVALVASLNGLKAKATKDFFKPYIIEHDRIVSLRRNMNVEANRANPCRQRFVVYIDGSLRALAFKRTGSTDTTNFKNSFYDEQFQGGEGRVGLNWSVGGSFLFGLSLGYGKAENLASLTKTEYTIRTTQANQSQQLISEKKVTAYAGDFKTFDRTSVNVDLVWFAWRSDSAVIAIDPYLRHRISSDHEVLPDHTDLGISLNFYRPMTGAFCGGLFVESGDVTNAIAKAAAERNNDTNALNDLNPFYKRLTFGLTVKLSLASLSSLGRP